MVPRLLCEGSLYGYYAAGLLSALGARAIRFTSASAGFLTTRIFADVDPQTIFYSHYPITISKKRITESFVTYHSGVQIIIIIVFTKQLSNKLQSRKTY
jgi:predicted acyltransferase